MPDIGSASWRDGAARALFEAGRLLGRTRALKPASRLLTAAGFGICGLDELVRVVARNWNDIREYQSEEFLRMGLLPFEMPVLERLSRGMRVAVAGCGGGRDLLALESMGLRADGVELSASAAACARRELAARGARGAVYCGDAADFVFPDGPYDAFIFSWLAYAYMPGRQRRVGALRRCGLRLAPRGRVFLTVKESVRGGTPLTIRVAAALARLTRSSFRPGPGDVLHEGPIYERRFTRAELASEAEEAGLALSEWVALPCAMGVDRMAVLGRPAVPV